MFSKKYLLIACAALTFTLSACDTTNSLFEGPEPARLEGERISILALQKELTPSAKNIKVTLPKIWENRFWPQAGGYPGHILGNLALDNPPLQIAWQSKIGEGSTSRIPLNASPIAVAGKVFQLDTSSNVSAFDAFTGELLWRSLVKRSEDDDQVISGGISYANKILFVTSGYDDVHALNAETGEEIWRAQIGAPSRAAPTLIKGRVFVTTVDNRLLALRESDGAVIWEYTGIGESAGIIGAASPAANEDIVIPVFSSGEISALRVENGSLAWSDNLSNIRRGGGLGSITDIRAMPVLDDDLVYAISFSGRIAAIDTRTGVRAWQHEVGGSQTPWIAGRFLYAITGDNQLAAFEKTKGDIAWVKPLKPYHDGEPIQWFGPVMADNLLIATNSIGEIVFFNPLDGAHVRTQNIDAELVGAPMIADRVLYLLSEDGILTALVGEEPENTENSDKDE